MVFQLQEVGMAIIVIRKTYMPLTVIAIIFQIIYEKPWHIIHIEDRMYRLVVQIVDLAGADTPRSICLNIP